MKLLRGWSTSRRRRIGNDAELTALVTETLILNNKDRGNIQSSQDKDSDVEHLNDSTNGTETTNPFVSMLANKIVIPGNLYIGYESFKFNASL